MSVLFSYIILGISLSAPIGPINAAQLDRGARHGFMHAWILGLGAMFADLVYIFADLFWSCPFSGHAVHALFSLVIWQFYSDLHGSGNALEAKARHSRYIYCGSNCSKIFYFRIFDGPVQSTEYIILAGDLWLYSRDNCETYGHGSFVASTVQAYSLVFWCGMSLWLEWPVDSTNIAVRMYCAGSLSFRESA